MQKTIIIASDMHIGSSVGLCPPKINLDDGGTYRPSRGQRWLWDNWTDFIDRAGAQPCPIVIINGDAIEADSKNRSYQLVTRNKATLQRIASECLEQLLKVTETYYFTRGTGAHGGKSAQYEEELAADFDPVRDGENYTWWHLYLRCEGVSLDIAHHAPLSGMPYGVMGAAERLAQKIVLAYHDQGDPIPDLVIRSHNHKFGDSGSLHRTRAIYTGAFCLPTEYSHKLGFDLADVGGWFIHIDGKNYEAEPVRYKPKGRVWQRV